MRLRVLSILLVMAVSVTAQATPVSWTLNGTITNSRTLGNFGSPSVGAAVTANMTVNTDAVDQNSSASDTGYYNPFETFELSIGNSLLTLGPNATDLSLALESNSIVSTIAANRLVLELRTLLFDGASAYQAIFLFNFSDLSAFPDGQLPATPPSLTSATLKQFDIYSPVDGVAHSDDIFLAEGIIDSFSATPVTVTEPNTTALFMCAFLMLMARYLSNMQRNRHLKFRFY